MPKKPQVFQLWKLLGSALFQPRPVPGKARSRRSRAVFFFLNPNLNMGSKREFGSGSRTFRRGFNRKLGSTRANSSLQRYGLPTGSASEPTVRNQRFEHIRKLDEIESRFGFDRYKEGPERLGWLINMHEVPHIWF